MKYKLADIPAHLHYAALVYHSAGPNNPLAVGDKVYDRIKEYVKWLEDKEANPG